MSTRLLFLLNILCAVCSFHLLKGLGFRFRSFSTFKDISPDQSRGLLKRTVKSGLPNTTPLRNDTLEISWTMKRENGTIIDASTDETYNSPTSTFVFGSTPRQVPLGWEIAFGEMQQGEVAEVQMSSEYGFGAAGYPDLQIAPNETIHCELQLHNVVPAITRKYQPVGANESIEEELVEKMNRGESPLSRDYQENIPTVDPSLHNCSSGENTNTTVAATKKPIMFDATKHRLLPKQRIFGEGTGHCWEETEQVLELIIPLPQAIDKSDIRVNVTSGYVEVQDNRQPPTFRLAGPLHGRVLATEAMWTLDGSPDSVRGPSVVVSMLKCPGYKDIWATVFSREFLSSQKNQTISQG